MHMQQRFEQASCVSPQSIHKSPAFKVFPLTLSRSLGAETEFGRVAEINKAQSSSTPHAATNRLKVRAESYFADCLKVKVQRLQN